MTGFGLLAAVLKVWITGQPRVIPTGAVGTGLRMPGGLLAA
jgi:hypothetical protein